MPEEAGREAQGPAEEWAGLLVTELPFSALHACGRPQGGRSHLARTEGKGRMRLSAFLPQRGGH